MRGGYRGGRRATLRPMFAPLPLLLACQGYDFQLVMNGTAVGDATDAFGWTVPLANVRTGKPASEILHLFDPVPQLLKNVRYEGASPLDNDAVKSAIAAAEAELEGKGRLVIRASGTEPLIRVMAEGDDAAQVQFPQLGHTCQR